MDIKKLLYVLSLLTRITLVDYDEEFNQFLEKHNLSPFVFNASINPIGMTNTGLELYTLLSKDEKQLCLQLLWEYERIGNKISIKQVESLIERYTAKKEK